MSQYVVELLHGNELFATDRADYWHRPRAEREAIKLSRMFPTLVVRLTEVWSPVKPDKVKHYLRGRVHKLN